MGLEQRVKAYARSAKDDFYRWQSMYYTDSVTNWRMLIARRFKISIAEVRRILAEGEQ
jgi:DNA-binding transcriptional regulator LsrR (DeoR family)